MEYLSECLACNSTNFEAFEQTIAMMHQNLPSKYNFDRCNACGLVFLNPRVDETELGQFYTASYLPYRVEEAWGKYASFVKQDQQKIDKARVQRLINHTNLSNQSRILDIGCGKPTFLASLRNSIQANLIGLDFSDEGWKNDRDSYHNIDLRTGEIADLGNEKPMDIITMWHYLEHDYQPQQHLKQLLNYSHAHTRLIIEVPNFNSYTRNKFGKHWSGYHTPRHTALYSPKNIELMLKNSGWQVDQILTYGTLNPYTLHWMSRMEQKGIDWSASMEPRFIGYVIGMVLNAPLYLLQKYFSMGFMTIIARPI
jgi:2-polyprenyl-3-methyl-5-hydroxy-6-metoxy-1,4-benzoquinol methylase|tara:strand:+ start:6597 stop:7529 length:933 start_codon:yes stop_codon:yes gene_type:complete